ncbi:Peptidase M20 domain-containing protein 2 [Colletotrichum sp. SAR 10_77]|nr:Peptidase M20 domain-containing protein 2 [Colletotrichum sp. SAR 10_75]KAI8264738.1 Peptidase M20 domain-containing protein 2 [Colletotrichum sp. SAR 10_77]
MFTDRIIKIWENPEIGYQEVHAHQVLTDYLEEQGFKVTRSAYNLSTAFRAEFSNGEGRAVSFNSEFDALPGLGHACGHNLIATVGVAAAIGVKDALENGSVKGSVVRLTVRPRRDVVLDQVQSILYASGNGTNTTVEITPFQDYWDQNPSFQLASTFYQHQMKYLDPANDPKTANFTVSSPEDSRRDGGASASSDQGNVSWFLPAIQVGFPVGGGAPVHNAGFRELAGTDFAHESAIQTAKILALTGLEVLQNETYAETMWEEWRAMIEEVSVSV